MDATYESLDNGVDWSIAWRTVSLFAISTCLKQLHMRAHTHTGPKCLNTTLLVLSFLLTLTRKEGSGKHPHIHTINK